MIGEGKVLYQEVPARKLLIWWFFRKAVRGIGLIFFIYFIFVFRGVFFKTYGVLSDFLYFMLGVVILYILYLVLLIRTYKYKITDRGIIFEGGLLIKRVRNVPYHKITDVTIVQNIIHRILGIYSLDFHTAGTGMRRAEIKFEGLTEPEYPKKIVLGRVDKMQKSIKFSE